MARLLTGVLAALAWGSWAEESGSGEGPPPSHIPTAVTSYLSRFGYLGKQGKAGSLRTEAGVRAGIRRLQSFAGLAATGEVDAATEALLATKRCGLPDYPDFPEPDHRPQRKRRARRRRTKRWLKQGAVWGHNNLTFRVENWTTDLGPGRVRQIVHESLRLWADVSSLSFTETRSSDADIKIKFVRREHGDGYSFDGPNVVLAHAFFPGQGIGGDAHFDDDETWTDQPIHGYSQEVNLYSVAAHEFGHSLGLAHSSEPDSLMFPYYRHTLRKQSLPCDDTWGIQELYGTGGNPVPEGEECESRRRVPVPTTTAPPPTPPSTQPTTTPEGPPEPCKSHVDAVARIRNEVFVFKGPYFWRFDRRGYLVEAATHIHRFWQGLPENLTRVDAVYERRVGGRDEIVFFAGRLYWVFSATRAQPGYPKSLASLGLPEKVERIDAAFIWTYNSKTYLFAGSEYWRVDEAKGRVLEDYPRRLSVWKGVPEAPDAVFTDHHDKTYFWKADQVYLFNSFFMAVDKRFPVGVAEFWTHCSGSQEIRFAPVSSAPRPSTFPAAPLLSLLPLIARLLCP